MMFASVVTGAVGGLTNPGLRAVLCRAAEPGEVSSRVR